MLNLMEQSDVWLMEAGLAMATMDLINFMGSSPANFLDIGGGSDMKAIKQAIEIINDDK